MQQVTATGNNGEGSQAEDSSDGASGTVADLDVCQGETREDGQVIESSSKANVMQEQAASKDQDQNQDQDHKHEQRIDLGDDEPTSEEQCSEQLKERKPRRLASPELYPVGSEGVAHLGGNKLGKFTQLQTDFTPTNTDSLNRLLAKKAHQKGHRSLADFRFASREYEDDDDDDNDGIKRVRFGICVLALLGMALGIMSRLILNVSIVEMVKQRPLVVEGEESDEDSTLISVDEYGTTPSIIDATLELPALDNLNGSIPFERISNMSSIAPINGTNETVAEEEQDDDPRDLDEIAGLRFNWTKKEVNTVLGAFYVGYIPGILAAGAITNRYGAKGPILAAILGTALINLLTPSMARVSVHLLVASRTLLGALQGPLTPCLYDLFSKWLTATESSIFAPMIKVSMPMGSLIGTLMPGILSTFGFKWPILFYLGGSFCLLWSVLWWFFASSTPQVNRFVEPSELRHIMRKKPAIVSRTSSDEDEPKKSVPWIEIITNSSVLALTLVKFTYNACMDLIYLELAMYLREVHSASIETISAIASATYCIQMVMITFVAWMAKSAVSRRLFGLSKTKWRKIFQGGSNFCMALAYLALPYFDDSLEPAAALLLGAAFFWMLGAGGESLLPYDLSAKYPASIVGLAHSVSKFSGLSVPILCQLVLGEDTDDESRWNLLFGLVGGAAAFGGLVFVLVVKAKPFLAEERLDPNEDQTSCSKEADETKERLASIKEGSEAP